MSSTSSDSSDSGEDAVDEHSENGNGSRRKRIAARHRERLLRRLQEAEEDNSTDIAIVVMLCTVFVILLIAATYLMQGDDAFASRNRRQSRSRYRKANPTVVDLSFSLNDLYTGTTRTFKVQRQIVCPSLRTGDGPSRANCQTKANLCRGRELRTQAQRDFFSGRIDRTFFCRFMARVQAHIPPGTRHGDSIEIEGAGNVRPGMQAGDVVVRVVQLSNRIFQRDGDDLQFNISLSLREALLGWSREVTHLDGRTVVVSSALRDQGNMARTTAIGEVVVVRGEGMPKKVGSSITAGWFSSSADAPNGDLRAVADIKFPRMKRLPRELRKKVARLFE